MAREIATYPNSSPRDSDYPSGRIKDKGPSSPGTPINEYTNGDIQQFFAKMMRESGIVYNGLPDSEYAGHQFWGALQSSIKYYTDNTIKVIVPIGTWNMDSTATLVVAHGIPSISILNIRSVNVIIINDSQDGLYPLSLINNSSWLPAGTVSEVNASSILLSRRDSGDFDTTAFDGTQNRGFVVFDLSL